MIDLDKLEAEREAATIDKADLFDFYHNNWDALVAALRDQENELERQLDAQCQEMKYNRLANQTNYYSKNE